MDLNTCGIFGNCVHNTGQRLIVNRCTNWLFIRKRLQNVRNCVLSTLTNRKCKYEIKNIITLTIDYKYVLGVNILLFI